MSLFDLPLTVRGRVPRRSSSCHTDTVLCIDGVRTLAAGGRRWLLDTDDVLDTTSVMS